MGGVLLGFVRSSNHPRSDRGEHKLQNCCEVCVCVGESCNLFIGLGQVTRGLVMLSAYKTARAPEGMLQDFE